MNSIKTKDIKKTILRKEKIIFLLYLKTWESEKIFANRWKNFWQVFKGSLIHII